MLIVEFAFLYGYTFVPYNYLSLRAGAKLAIGLYVETVSAVKNDDLAASFCSISVKSVSVSSTAFPVSSVVTVRVSLIHNLEWEITLEYHSTEMKQQENYAISITYLKD